MRKVLSILLLALMVSSPAIAEVWEARYGVAEVFNFKLYNADGTLDVDEADAGTEVTLSCNEGAQTTATNDFVDEGDFYSISLTAAELQCERLAVVVAATTTEVFFIQTSQNASAFTPTVEANVASVATGAIAAGDFAAGAIDASAVAPDAIGASEMAANAIGSSEVADGAIDAAAVACAAGSFGALGITNCGTAQTGSTSTTFVLASAANYGGDSGPVGQTIMITGGTGVGQSRYIDTYANATDTATMALAWTTTPDNTSTYVVFGTAASLVSGGGGLDAAGVRAALGLASANLDTLLLNIDNFVDDVESRLGTPIDLGIGGATVSDNLQEIEDKTDSVPADVWANGTRTLSAGTNIVLAKGTGITGFTDLDAAAVRAAVGLATANLDVQLDALPTAAENATAVSATQGIIIGTCDSGSTTTCVDNALTQGDAAQLSGRLICFDDALCALITTFTPGTDTVTTTKVAPSTRAARVYTIFPATLE